MSRSSRSIEEELEQAVSAELDEVEKAIQAISTPVRTYLIVAVALGVAAWNITFNLGAYQTIFFHHLFFVWIAATVTLIAGLFLQGEDAFIDRMTLFALLLPSGWLLTVAILPTGEGNVTLLADIWLTVIQIATVFSLPYLAFALLYLTQPDTFALPGRLRVGLLVVVLLIALSGYLIGSNHRTFLTCSDFVVSGNDTPADCINE